MQTDSEDIIICPSCGESFTVEQLVQNQDIVPIGMRHDEDELTLNFYYFKHVIESCKAIFMVPIRWFHSLLTEPAPLANMAGSCSCAQHCSRLENFTLCQKECSWAPYRKLLIAMMQAKGISVPENRPQIMLVEL